MLRTLFEQKCQEVPKIIAQMKAWQDSHALPLLNLPSRTDDLGEIESAAAPFTATQFDQVLVLGTGGSTLGGQTLLALADQGFGPKSGRPIIRFFDNVDPHSFEALMVRLNPSRTGLVIISKSGGTAETLAQALSLIPWIGPSNLAAQAVAVTEPYDNALRRLMAAHKVKILEHDPKVGGRFSVLSVVGLLPAAIGGLDIKAVRRGAATVLKATLDQVSSPPSEGAALSVAAMMSGKPMTVLMPYIDRLACFARWYRQLWAESIGKDGKGSTPIDALGTVDQHSQVQLYLGGPKDKLFSLILLNVASRGPQLMLSGDKSLDYLKDRTLGDLMDAEQRATAATLIRNGRSTRLFHLDHLDETSLGALLMHFMLETIIAAGLMGVDAFDQPAVEEGKSLTRQYLAEMMD
ncbi:MAG: glucose-6-phosphate isomerase [Alphaproteobacteria bacterium]